MRRSLRVMLFLISAAVAGTAGAVIALALRVDRFSRSQPVPLPVKAIVVLGARVVAPAEASPALARRAEKAAELYRSGVAPLLIFSGGFTGELPSEASVARDLVVKLGVPASACMLEEASHSTRQNAELTAALLRERSIEYVNRQVAHDPLALGYGYEVGGRQQSASRVLPAYEGLHAREAAAFEGLLWLIVQEQLRRPHRLAKLADQCQVITAVGVARRDVALDEGAPRLGSVHRDVRAAKQLRAVQRVMRGQSNSYARLHRYREAVQGKGLVKRVAQRISHS